MTASNEDIVRQLLALWNENRDPRELLDPDVEYVNPPNAVEPGTHRGHAGWRTALASVRDTFGAPRLEIERIESGGDRVAAGISLQLATPAAGMHTDVHLSLLWTLAGGRVTRLEWFSDPDRAFELLYE